MERDPDIAALAARLGLRRLTYRSFARPVLVPPAARAEPDPLPATEPPQPAVAVAAPPAVIADRVASLPVRPFVPAPAGAPPMLSIVAAPVANTAVPPVVMAPAPHFPLLAQALTYAAASPAWTAVPASAQPFLNLRRAVAGPSDAAEH